MKHKDLIQLRKRRASRVRARVRGTAECPRLSVMRSNTSLYAQMIDDNKGVTLVSASTREVGKAKNKTDAAMAVGSLIAKKAKEKKITKAVFDRGSYRFHGRVRACVEAARKEGLMI